MYQVEHEDILNHVYYEFNFPCIGINKDISQRVYELSVEDRIAQSVCDYFNFGVNTDNRFCSVSYYHDYSIDNRDKGGSISVGVTLGKDVRCIFSPEELVGVSEKAIAPIFKKFMDSNKFKFSTKAKIEGEVRVTTRVVITND